MANESDYRKDFVGLLQPYCVGSREKGQFLQKSIGGTHKKWKDRLRGNELFPSTKHEQSLQCYLIILWLRTIMMSDHPASLEYHVSLSPKKAKLAFQASFIARVQACNRGSNNQTQPHRTLTPKRAMGGIHIWLPW